MNELNNNTTSLPLLPVSLRSSFTSLPSGVRGVVRGYFHKVFLLVWPFRAHLHPSTAPISLLFLLPGVLTRLELNIYDMSALSAVFFLSGGGKRGVLTTEVVEVTGIIHYYMVLQRLQKAGYLTRSNFDPSAPSRDKDHKFIQHRYLFITAEGVQVLKDLNGAFRSEFYGVINRAAFGPENCSKKKPGSTE